MKETNKEKKRNPDTERFQPNGDPKQAPSFEVSLETTENNRINIMEVKA